MAGSRREGARVLRAAALASVALGGCAVGDGDGELFGVFQAARCNRPEPESIDLRPSFFGADPVEDQLNLRIQRGSEREFFADGVILHILDVNDLRLNRLDEPIELGDFYRDPIQAVAYLNATCRLATPLESFFEIPPAYRSVGGTITFSAVYAPEIDMDDTLIEATLTDVRFEDAVDPEEFAVLSGSFRFFFQRGAPAQRFPRF
ncbi:MAG: hypothetical protein ACFCGT_07785 [Sandaracinaceae bacterium]